MRSKTHLSTLQKMSPAFYQNYRTGDLIAHATNDINSLTRLAGGGVMSAVDASITALVTLLTMLFSILVADDLSCYSSLAIYDL